jgi:hypothetical protein
VTRFRRTKSLKELRKDKVLKENEDKKLESITEKVSTDIEENFKALKKIFGEKPGDVVFRRFHIRGKNDYKAFIAYIDGMVDNATVDNFILRTTMFETRAVGPDEPIVKRDLVELIKEYSLTIDEVAESDQLKKAVSSMLNGDTALFIDGNEKAFGLNTKGWEHRQVAEPKAEAVIRGPREGFTETLRTNTALIRTRLKDPYLRVKNYVLGKRTSTNVAVIYIEGICEDSLIKKVDERIEKINIDGVMGSGYVEQLIEDSHWSPFPTVQDTERPDKAVANLLEGRIIIIVDGTPFVLMVPAILSQFYQSPEDYYERFWIGTFIRFIRVISLFFALLAPSLYIAFTAFHPEMIPTELVLSVAAGRATVPFPAVIEAFIMEISIEILREASVRLPGIIGPTIGIVGALVIGQAAVQAGLVSPLMVIIVSLTTIGSFASPNYSAAIAIRILRFPMMVAAGTFGLYGIMLFWLLIILHLCTLKSFGVPYIAPLSPSHFSDLKDVILRAPLQWMKRRPLTIISEDDVREEHKGGGGNVQ